jgi:uncharacterized protein involved in copper resistance
MVMKQLAELCYLFCVLMLFSISVSAGDEQETADVISDQLNSSWNFHGMLNKFERQYSTNGDDQDAEWAAFLVLGNDPNAFWLTTKGATKHGETDSAEIRLFYSHKIAPHLGLQFGWRRDIEPEPNRDWLGFGLIAVLPFKIAACR